VIAVRQGCRLTVLAALIPLGGGCNAILGVDSHSLKPDAGGMSGTGGGAGGAAGSTSSCSVDGGATDADGADASTATTCGFVIPNFVPGLPSQWSYHKNTDQTVLDNITGLTWQGMVDNRTVSQSEAVRYCMDQDQTLGPWRLPTLLELTTLVDFTVPAPGPTINPIFADRPAELFWTSSVAACGVAKGWYVDFAKGDAHQDPFNTLHRIRCVRGAPPNCSSQRYSFPGDGTVHDATTGLTWSQNVTADQYLSWNDAATYCSTLGTGWRLPGPAELESLVDLTKQGPPKAPIDEAAFPDTPADNFWANSAEVGNSGLAWYVAFVHGHIDAVDVTLNYWVRCVRSDGP